MSLSNKTQLTMRFIYGALIFLMLASLVSCDPCNYVDCATDNYYGQFRVVSAGTAKDLVFGPNSIYDKNRIRFYSLNGTDTTFFDYRPLYFPKTGYDSILYVYFYPKTDIAYLRLSNGDIDTLAISYKTSKGSKCCGPIKEIATFRFNNSIDLPGDQGTQALMK